MPKIDEVDNNNVFPLERKILKAMHCILILNMIFLLIHILIVCCTPSVVYSIFAFYKNTIFILH